MPYEIIWTKRCVEWRYSGALLGSEIIESNNLIYGDERFDDLHFQIVDLSNVECFKIKESTVRQMAHLDKAAAKSNPRIKMALVAPNSKSREIAEAYIKHSGQSVWSMAIFESRDEAINWLGSRAS